MRNFQMFSSHPIPRLRISIETKPHSHLHRNQDSRGNPESNKRPYIPYITLRVNPMPIASKISHYLIQGYWNYRRGCRLHLGDSVFTRSREGDLQVTCCRLVDCINFIPSRLYEWGPVLNNMFYVIAPAIPTETSLGIGYVKKKYVSSGRQTALDYTAVCVVS